MPTPSPLGASLDPAVAGRLKRDRDGLVAAVVQQHDTGEVLMLGWMDDEALHRTLTTGRVTFWSRSRGEYWRKGDTSGTPSTCGRSRSTATATPCSSEVDQVGAACHTGTRTCFEAGGTLPAVVGERPAEPDVVGRDGRRRPLVRRPAAAAAGDRRPDRAGRPLEDATLAPVEVPWGTTWPAVDEFRELAADRRVIPVVRRLLADDVTPGRPLPDARQRPARHVHPRVGRESTASWARHSFVGVRSRATLTVRDGRAVWTGDVPAGVPTEGVPDRGARRDARRAAHARPIPGLPPLTGGLVGALGWDIVRHWEPTLPAEGAAASSTSPR